jgi:hypothetical protein
MDSMYPKGVMSVLLYWTAFMGMSGGILLSKFCCEVYAEVIVRKVVNKRIESETAFRHVFFLFIFSPQSLILDIFLFKEYIKYRNVCHTF